MKQTILFLTAVATLSVAGCAKKTAVPSTGLYKGVVVVNACSQAMVQTLGPSYLGAETWSAGAGAPVYHHVFAVQNGCQFGDHHAGDAITFKVIDPVPQNCMHCMVYVAVPDVSYAIQVQ